MSKRNFHITQGQVWHFGSITAPGQFDDFFLPLRLDSTSLIAVLTDERDAMLQGFDDTLEVSPAPFKVEDGKAIIRLKWKHSHIDEGSVVVVDGDNQPLTATNLELQDAKLKVSFYQLSWEYKGKCGTKLIPRKIQLQSFGNLESVEIAEVFNADASSDF